MAKKPPAPTPVSTGFWLMKSEPDVFSWDDLKARGPKGEPWTGVRNYLARNNMRAMNVGDLGFFYHSNIGKEVVGILRVIQPAHPDPDDDSGVWECVDVEAVCDLPKPVTLAQVKADAVLKGSDLARLPRLSVMPFSEAQFERLWRSPARVFAVFKRDALPLVREKFPEGRLLYRTDEGILIVNRS